MPAKHAGGRARAQTGISNVTVGLLLIVVTVVILFFAFTKSIPFRHDFRLQAVVQSSNGLRPGAAVRIAGVNVGKVKGIKRQPGASATIITMEIEKEGLPLHKDATLKIRPRIFLEGNWFVDLRPGTPAEPVIDDDDTLPITQTATPVQLDQILTALQENDRDNLKKVLTGLGTAWNAPPTAAQDADADPDTRGETAAKSLNDSIGSASKALKGTAQLNEATLGSNPDDLSRLLKGFGTVSKALIRNESQLQDLVENLDTTMTAFASKRTELSRSISLLAPTLETTNTALDSLNAAFPDTRAFAREVLPGVRATPATIKAGFPWLKQANGLLSEAELKGLAADVQPLTKDLSKVSEAGMDLFPKAGDVAKCLFNPIITSGGLPIQDGDFSTGKPAYYELWYAMVGLAGEGASFDGNGSMIRVGTGGGDNVFATGIYDTVPKPDQFTKNERLLGTAASPPLGTRPPMPASKPAYNDKKPCVPEPQSWAAATGPADGASAAAKALSDKASQPIPAAPTTTTPAAAAAARKTAAAPSADKTVAGLGGKIFEALDTAQDAAGVSKP